MITQTFQPSMDTRPTTSLDLDVSLGELHLEVPCPKCNDRNPKCEACGGLGVVLNANGARLLALFRRHLEREFDKQTKAASHEPGAEAKKG